VAELISQLHPQRIRGNLERLREEIAAGAERAGRDPRAVEVLAATKYVAAADLHALQQAGVHLVGENRAQDLEQKVALYGDAFTWDFIGQLQSRKVRRIVPHVRLIHSVASESSLRELARHRDGAAPGLRILIEVNVSGEPGKAGIEPAALPHFLEAAPLPVAGLMTMPPISPDPDASRPWFAALRELARAHGLEQLSMGTSQDYLVAVEEGATIVRIGTKLYT